MLLVRALGSDAVRSLMCLVVAYGAVYVVGDGVVGGLGRHISCMVSFGVGVAYFCCAAHFGMSASFLGY